MAPRSHDVSEWIKAVYAIKGRSEFAVSDLPEDLYSNTIQTKCHSLGLLKKTSRSNNAGRSWKWEITFKGECFALDKPLRAARAEKTLSYHKQRPSI